VNEQQKWMFGLVQPFIKNGGAATTGVAPVPLVSFPMGFHYPFQQSRWASNLSNLTIDAATEKVAQCGRVYMLDRASGAKTLSAAGGGSISFRLSTTTFADGATTVEIGLQDLGTATGNPGRPDGTFDVSRVLTGGGGGLTTAAWNTVSMTGGSGTKTLSHGDPICVVFDMTARGGADSILVTVGLSNDDNTNAPSLFPFVSQFVSSAWAAVNTRRPNIVLTFDDGTLAIIDDSPAFSSIAVTGGFSDTNNPDERGIIFQVPFDCKVDALWTHLQTVNATTSDFNLVLYSDPTGTPTPLATVTVLAETLGGLGDRLIGTWLLPSEIALTRNTNYCLATRASGTGTIFTTDLTLGDAAHRGFLLGGTSLLGGTRQNDTGAFATSTTVLRPMGVRISQVPEYVSP
jgi:hypothetical protein